MNENIREALNLKGKGQEFSRFEAGDFTEAQKKRIDSYEVGQDVRFGKDYREMGVRSGEVGNVAEVDKERGTVKLTMQDGRTTILTPRKISGKGHEIGQIEKIELAPGDRIRITGNERKKDGITNGMRGVVLNVGQDTLRIRLDNGKECELNPGPVEVDHGYAQTGHSAQGLGAQIVILDLPANSQTMNRRSFYTNLTRTKGKVIAFTDDREKLTGAVTREKDKSMALDVEKENREEKRRVKERGGEKEAREEVRPEVVSSMLTGDERKLLSEWKGKEGQEIRFSKDVRAFGIGAGESGKIEDINQGSGVITLRMEDGRYVRMIPEYMRELERQKGMEERAPDRKTMDPGKEDRKEKKKESPGIECRRERGRDRGMGY